MAFFPYKFYNNNSNTSSFHPLFRLLDDFENSRHITRQAPAPHWQPKFDIRETENAYTLHGEIPGAEQENVNIWFTDPQTLVIQGTTKRTQASKPSSSDRVDVTTANEPTPTPTEKKRASYQATVEDDPEETSSTTSSNAQDSPKESELTEVEKPQEFQQPKEKPAGEAKYWLTERNIGEFSRSFHFPTRVDQDATTANFTQGILNINVPKLRQHQPRYTVLF